MSTRDEEVRVYLNGAYVGDITVGPTDTWALSVFPVVAAGNGQVVAQQMLVGELGCFCIAWGTLEITEVKFLPEPAPIMQSSSGLVCLSS